MPNIEIHGHFFADSQEVQKIKERIEALLGGELFAGEIIIGQVLDYFHDFAGQPKPFLRVWDSDETRGRRIQNILRMNGFEVERPVKLASFVEPAMWSETEISADLCSVVLKEWLQGRSLATLLDVAIEALEKHDYVGVASFYIKMADFLRISFVNCLPTAGELNRKVRLEELNVLWGWAMQRKRFILVIQIIDSLVPEWGKKEYYTAKE